MRVLLAAGVIGVVVAATAAPAAAAPRDGAGSKVLNCAACHGAAGQSRSDAMPILAGAHPVYFKKAIQDYASGKRLSPEMEPYAKQVLVLGLDEIAAYFAAQRREPSRVKLDAAAVERGRTASTQCAPCHGPAGKGDADKGVPDIGGQPPGYLRNQLLLFKAERRSPGDEAVTKMKALLKAVPDDTLGDLAAYYSSLR
ncbi:MAG: c-type cytochrome [Candidatus Rokubacteria bacterium]|nr:c-type cytochrome [Candidatus Rokubacteria bacterium]